MLKIHEDKIKSVAPYLYIILGLLVVFFFNFRMFNPLRVGDGGEYYALYYAWDTTSRPWMTSIAYDAYEKMYASHSIRDFVSRDVFENAFPALKLGVTGDFPHFWFYSFLAFLCAKLLSLIGITLQVHKSFLVLHYILLVVTTSISYRFYRWNGVLVVLLMTFISPMLWYLDKVHTELFTLLPGAFISYINLCQKILAGSLVFGFGIDSKPQFRTDRMYSSYLQSDSSTE